ncbi:13456_t:CDS:2, partial [Entrophospora sp. SA101]
ECQKIRKEKSHVLEKKYDDNSSSSSSSSLKILRESSVLKLSEIYKVDESTIANILERNNDLLDDLDDSFINITKVLDSHFDENNEILDDNYDNYLESQDGESSFEYYNNLSSTSGLDNEPSIVEHSKDVKSLKVAGGVKKISEAYLVNLLEDAWLAATHANCVTIQPKDIELVLHLYLLKRFKEHL